MFLIVLHIEYFSKPLVFVDKHKRLIRVGMVEVLDLYYVYRWIEWRNGRNVN